MNVVASRKLIAAVLAIAIIAAAAWYALAYMHRGSPSSALQNSTSGQRPTVCDAFTTFSCSSLSFQDGRLALTFTQATGSDWEDASLQFVPIGGAYNYGSGMQQLLGGLRNGSAVSVTIGVPNSVVSASSVGGALEGSLYANYTTGSGQHFVRVVAAVDARQS